ncbi:hypothetical protein [Natrinema versiforme]|uniref:hypothetical protein n=1 Tax=Natrinema TaxID=88723 RepID=UPI001586C989|nr:hypothetical protein [Natrinema versiforme]
MVGAALQRFAILVVLLGGFLELSSKRTGIGFMLFAALIGVIGLAIELLSEELEQ